MIGGIHIKAIRQLNIAKQNYIRKQNKNYKITRKLEKLGDESMNLRIGSQIIIRKLNCQEIERTVKVVGCDNKKGNTDDNKKGNMILSKDAY